MTEERHYPTTFPEQHQDNQPGLEHKMSPLPLYHRPSYAGSDKLKGKTALITGGDSGIGRAIALHFAKEGANVAIVYYNETNDALLTKQLVEDEDQTCLLIQGDIGDDFFCNLAVRKTAERFGAIHILINNAAEQHTQKTLEDISQEQLERTFRTNVFGTFHMTKAALSFLPAGSSIINTSSVTAYEGHDQLIDYASTKGAITAFTRSLAKNLVKKGIRVNGVAPGPIWTPLIPASFDEKHVASFGSSTPMQRSGQPEEVAPAFVYLASDDASYMTGQMLHINGGIITSS